MTVSSFTHDWIEQLPECMSPTTAAEYHQFADLMRRTIFYYCLNDAYIQRDLCDMDGEPTFKAYFDQAVLSEQKRRSFQDSGACGVMFDPNAACVAQLDVGQVPQAGGVASGNYSSGDCGFRQAGGQDGRSRGRQGSGSKFGHPGSSFGGRQSGKTFGRSGQQPGHDGHSGHFGGKTHMDGGSGHSFGGGKFGHSLGNGHGHLHGGRGMSSVGDGGQAGEVAAKYMSSSSIGGMQRQYGGGVNAVSQVHGDALDEDDSSSMQSVKFYGVNVSSDSVKSCQSSRKKHRRCYGCRRRGHLIAKCP